MSPTQQPNHLRGQTSPYLLQHLHNPVDWYPWGPEALERARREDKPIFLSIGYAACHWCHVMERESFEDERVAAFLNEHFVSIKVDREERPDVDEIYMTAVQLLTGAGGWPLNVFLAPDLRPFFGGTYFPPDARYGRAPFLEVLRQLQQTWSGQRDRIHAAAEQLTERIRSIAEAPPASDTPLGRAELRRSCAELVGRFDSRWGGFGNAPKFPPDGGLDLLLREHDRSGEAVPLQVAVRTLDAMAEGGMYDQVGGGFARYSVDERWLVPHFEKMLYNQGLLVPVYVDAWRITGKPAYRRIVEETLDFVRRELTGAEGGFLSSLDADSEGEEGRFYVWTPDEIRAVLGKDDGDWICTLWGVTDAGNFEGRNIPCLLGGSLAERARQDGLSEERLAERLRPLRARLLDARERRVRPGTDDKVLTAWNGLMISACAQAFRAFGRAEDLASAGTAAAFLLDRMWDGQRLLAAFREGKAHLNGYLDDYAFLGRGLLDLYEAGFDATHLANAEALATSLLERFFDEESGTFWFTAGDHERLLVRTRSRHDGALPSGAGVAIELLVRLAAHLDAEPFRRAAARALGAMRAEAAAHPSAFAASVRAGDMAAGPFLELAIAGDPGDPRTVELIRRAGETYAPRLALAQGAVAEETGRSAILAGKQADRPTAWVCRNYACNAPTDDPAELSRQLRTAREA